MKKFLAGALVTGIPLMVTTVFFAKRTYDNMKFVDFMLANIATWSAHPEEVDWEQINTDLRFIQITFNRGIPKG